MTTTITNVNANALRRAAEKADGMRGQTLALVMDEKEFVDVIPLDEARNAGREVLLEISTSNTGDGLPGDAKLIVSRNNQNYGHGTIVDAADAVFTSQSAVEKFVLPYYVHYKSLDDIKELREKLFINPNVIAAVHIPPSATSGLEPAKLFGLKENVGSKPSFDLIG